MSELPKNKKVLILAYFFPPIGGGGVQRTVKFVKYLREFGWEPVVLTVRSGKHTAFDNSFDKDLPKDLRIIRTRYLGLPQPKKKPEKLENVENSPKSGAVSLVKGLAKAVAIKVYRFIETYLFYPDINMLWRPFAYRAALKLMKNEHFDLVYSTSSPYTSHLIARDVHRITGVPWVADFRDHWTLGPLYKRASWLHSILDRHFERSILSEASGLVFNTKTNEKEALGAFKNVATNHTSIYNGFDPDDFVKREASRQAEVIQTYYIGSLYGEEYSCKELVSAFERACGIKKNVRLTFIGDIDRMNKEIIKGSSAFGKNIFLESYLPHQEVMKIEQSADLLFALVGSAPNTECWVPQKIYGYLGAGRPVFALASEKGEVAKILRETEAGEVVSQLKSTDEIASSLLRFLEKLEAQNFKLSTDSGAIRQFERKNLTRQLANFFSKVTHD